MSKPSAMEVIADLRHKIDGAPDSFHESADMWSTQEQLVEYIDEVRKFPQVDCLASSIGFLFLNISFKV